MTVQSTYTVTWGKQLARALNANFTIAVDEFFRAWAQAEGTTARFNPYATTLALPGSTQFNSVGVQNYATWQDGVKATSKTLLSPTYPEYGRIVAQIRKGTDAAAMATALAMSPWGTGGLCLRIVQQEAPPIEWPFGNCYPIPGASYSHGSSKIQPASWSTIKYGGASFAASAGLDVDELLRVIAIRKGVAGYKWYYGAPVEYVKEFQRKRYPLLLPSSRGVVGAPTFEAIVGHP